MFSILRTIWYVFLHSFQKRITVQYPEEKPYLAPRYRGRIILSRDPDGGERCVACNLCAVACPVDCIALQATEDEHGRRYPEFFRINFSRCIFCGYCEEACPTYAIQLTPDFEMGEFHRKNLVYEKQDLLIDGPGKYPDYNYWRWRESRSAAKIRARPHTKRRLSTSALCCRETLMELAFYIAGAVAVLSTVLMLTRLNVVHALLYLIVSLLGVAVVFYRARRPFVAALEVIIYAGAIMVLFVFVVMMLNLGEHAAETEEQWLTPGIWTGPVLLASILIIEVVYLARGSTAGLAHERGGTEEVGIALFGPYLIGVELASMLLLAGLVGAYHLGFREIEKPEIQHDANTHEDGLILAGILFSLGLTSLLVRRNLIFVLMSLEVMLNAAGLAFVVAGSRWHQADGQVMFLFILAMAAAEVAVGLALVLQIYHRFKSLDVDAAERDEGIT